MLLCRLFTGDRTPELVVRSDPMVLGEAAAPHEMCSRGVRIVAACGLGPRTSSPIPPVAFVVGWDHGLHTQRGPDHLDADREEWLVVQGREPLASNLDCGKRLSAQSARLAQ
jgi:hypothetical protein